MANRLKNTLTFSIAAGATSVIPHGLNINGIGKEPDVVFVPSADLAVTADDINVTLTNNSDVTQAGAVLVEYWHSVERAFGAVQTTDLPTKPYIVVSDGAGTGTGTPEFIPGRTLFVAKSWPVGSDPLVYFTKISDALVQAATMTPTSASPVAVLVYPGTYTDALAFVSNVHVVGTSQQRGVIVSGAATWTPAAGVNAPQAAATENFNTAFITYSGLFTIDTTAKGASTAPPICRGCIFTGGITYLGNATTSSQMIACALNSGAFSFNNVSGSAGIRFFGCSTLAALSFTGTTTFQILGGLNTVALALTDTASGSVVGGNVAGAAVGVGTSLSITGRITGAITGLGTVDVRGSNYNGNATIAGITGTCKRTTYTGSFGPTAIGANAVVFPVPYPDANYNVHLQLTAGAGDVGMTVTGKTGAGFTINDAVGTNTVDYTVVYD